MNAQTRAQNVQQTSANCGSGNGVKGTCLFCIVFFQNRGGDWDSPISVDNARKKCRLQGVSKDETRRNKYRCTTKTKTMAYGCTPKP